jgi:hypothetical protein
MAVAPNYFTEMLARWQIRVVQKQGDQIGRIFAYWAIANLASFFENYRRSTNFGSLFPVVKVMC